MLLQPGEVLPQPGQQQVQPWLVRLWAPSVQAQARLALPHPWLARPLLLQSSLAGLKLRPWLAQPQPSQAQLQPGQMRAGPALYMKLSKAGPDPQQADWKL